MKSTPIKLIAFKLIPLLTLASVLIAVSGCERKDPNHPELYGVTISSSAANVAAVTSSATEVSNSSSSAATAVNNAERADYATDAWVGKWQGPEGTFLNIEGNKGVYTLTIQNLDGPKTYAGRTLGDRISFDRDGVAETIHASDGKDTSMKWLADKKNCLMIREGEGFCRD